MNRKNTYFQESQLTKRVHAQMRVDSIAFVVALLNGIYRTRKARHLARGIFPVHRFTGILVQHGVCGDQRSGSRFTIIILNRKADSLDHIFDTGAGGAIAHGFLQTLLMALDSGLMVSQCILQVTRYWVCLISRKWVLIAPVIFCQAFMPEKRYSP